MNELKAGVYLKTTGKLVLLIKENITNSAWKYKWSLFDGRKSKNKMVKFLLGAWGDNMPFMAWESFSDKEYYEAWGPMNYLNKSEYLGEL